MIKKIAKKTVPKSSRVARLAAYVVDVVVISCVNLSITFLTAGNLTFVFMPLVVPFLYFWISTAMYGKSVGKGVFGLTVVSSDGTQMTWGKAFMREVVGKIVAAFIFLGLGYAWILFDKDRQGIHDKIAGTYVLQTSPLQDAKRVLAYILAFTIPVLMGMLILIAVLLAAINPAEQMRKAREAKQQQMLQQQYNQQLQNNATY